jgi:hypothetical protein
LIALLYRGGIAFICCRGGIIIIRIILKSGPPKWSQSGIGVQRRRTSYKTKPPTTPMKTPVAAIPAAALVPPPAIGIGAGPGATAEAVFEKVAVNRNALATVAHKTFFIRPPSE